jgi:signal transduction histidine kinase
MPTYFFRSFLLICLSLVVVDVAVASDAVEDMRRVVILNSTDPHLPAFIALDTALQSVVRESGVPVDFFDESLDLHRFASPGLEEKLVLLFKEKYRNLEVDVVVAYATAALEFAERYGDEIWPNAALVFHSVSDANLIRTGLGKNAAGVTSSSHFGDTIDLALKLRPETRQIAVVAGSSAVDQRLLAEVHNALSPHLDKLKIEYLNGLTVEKTLAAVQALPPEAIVIYTTMFQGGADVPLVPVEVLEMIADVAAVPVFGIFETYLGHGITAGFISSYSAQGRRAGEIVNRILSGEAPSDIGVQVPVPTHCMADWQQLEHWGISGSLLPDGCEILFRQTAEWKKYLWPFVVTLVVILAQLVLIGALLSGRRQLVGVHRALEKELALRREIERNASRLKTRLTRFARERSVGVMSTTIVHEVSQPLIAIQNYAQAASRRLQDNSANTTRVFELLDKIQKQAERAGAITQRVRTLVNDKEAEIVPASLDELIGEVIPIFKLECETQGCHIRYQHDGELPPVLADALEIQLVLSNLLSNALRSIKKRGDSGRSITIDTTLLDNGEVQVSVADQGVGIPPDQVQLIFEPLYSGASSGMGVGLAICQDILDLHGGRIWHEPNPGGGAIFRFTLRSSAV